MKKIILSISIILLLISIFFAYDKHFKYILPKEYKSEIEALLEKEIPKTKNKIDGLYEKIDNKKNNYGKIVEIESGVELVLYDLYWELFHTTEKYVGKDKIVNNLPCRAKVWRMYNILIPYLEINKIDTSKLLMLIEYGVKTQLDIEKKYGYVYEE